MPERQATKNINKLLLLTIKLDGKMKLKIDYLKYWGQKKS